MLRTRYSSAEEVRAGARRRDRRVPRVRLLAHRRHGRRPTASPTRPAGWGLTVRRRRPAARSGCCSTPSDAAADRPCGRTASPIAVTGGDVRTLRSVQLKGTVRWRSSRRPPPTATRAGAYCDAFFAAVEADRRHRPRRCWSGSCPPTYVRLHRRRRRGLRPDARARARAARWRRERRPRCARRSAPLLRGRDPRRDRDRVGRRHAERHLPLAGPRRRRRAHRPLEPVLLEDGPQPRREPAAPACCSSTRRPTTSTA